MIHIDRKTNPSYIILVHGLTQLLLFDMRRQNLQTKSSLSVTRVFGSSVVFLHKKCSVKFLMDSNMKSDEQKFHDCFLTYPVSKVIGEIF
jgi:hypothetical protein